MKRVDQTKYIKTATVQVCINLKGNRCSNNRDRKWVLL